jgi:hypothetical protein
MSSENRCQITGNFYSVINECEHCGKRFADHQGTKFMCRDCIVNKRVIPLDQLNLLKKTIAMILFICLAIPIVWSASYDWVRPIGGRCNIYNNYTNSTYFNYTLVNNTYINNTYINDTYINMSGNGTNYWNKSANILYPAEAEVVNATLFSHIRDRNFTKRNYSVLTAGIGVTGDFYYSLGSPFPNVISVPFKWDMTNTHHLYAAYSGNWYNTRGNVSLLRYSSETSMPLYNGTSSLVDIPSIAGEWNDGVSMSVNTAFTQGGYIERGGTGTSADREFIGRGSLAGQVVVRWYIVTFDRPFNRTPAVNWDCVSLNETGYGYGGFSQNYFTRGGVINQAIEGLNKFGFTGVCSYMPVIVLEYDPDPMPTIYSPLTPIYYGSWQAFGDEGVILSGVATQAYTG